MKNFFAQLDKFKGLLVDIDDTVYSYEEAHKAALLEVYSEIISKVTLQNFETFERKYKCERAQVTAFHKGSGSSRSRFLALQSLFEHEGLPTSYELALIGEDCYWRAFLANMKPKCLPIEVIKHFTLSGKPVCAVTDMQARYQVQKLVQLGLVRNINYLVTSEEVGVEKPSPEVFELALRKTNICANQALMIGDDLEKDIRGAQSMGIEAWQVVGTKILPSK